MRNSPTRGSESTKKDARRMSESEAANTMRYQFMDEENISRCRKMHTEVTLAHRPKAMIGRAARPRINRSVHS